VSVRRAVRHGPAIEQVFRPTFELTDSHAGLALDEINTPGT
jgi:hypothetical protein